MGPSNGPEGSAKGPSVTLFLFNLGLNFVLSPSIILLNKLVYTRYGFPNMTLTFIHFACTSIGMVICRLLGFFSPKPLSLVKMMPITAAFCGFVVLTNLSLQTNTVGTYQIIKSMTTPCIIIIQSWLYSRTFSTKVKFTVLPIIIGVCLNCGFDVKFSYVGLTFGLCGVVVTSLYQVWVKEKQLEFNVNSMQLLYYQAPLSALLLLCIIPFFEPVIDKGGIIGGPWSAEAVCLVSLTGAVAFGINMSIFWIIGNTSPLTYNMSGHMKFCITLFGGYIIFKDPMQPLQIAGMVVTFLGIVAYTHVKLQEQKNDSTQRQNEDLIEKDVESGNDKNNNMSHQGTNTDESSS